MGSQKNQEQVLISRRELAQKYTKIPVKKTNDEYFNLRQYKVDHITKKLDPQKLKTISTREIYQK
eukprot:403347061